MLSPGCNRGTRRIRADQAGGSPIAEQGGGDHVALRLVSRAESQTAELDYEEEPARARTHLGKRGGAGEAQHTTGAAEPEDRQPFDITPQAQTVDQHGIQAGRRDSCGGDDDNAVQLAWVEIRAVEHVAGSVLEQGERVVE